MLNMTLSNNSEAEPYLRSVLFISSSASKQLPFLLVILMPLSLIDKIIYI